MHNGNKSRSPAWWLFYSTGIKENECDRDRERNGREEVSEGGKQRVKEAQDKDVREGKEWGAIEENRGKGERAGESVTVACCRVRW